MTQFCIGKTQTFSSFLTVFLRVKILVRIFEENLLIYFRFHQIKKRFCKSFQKLLYKAFSVDAHNFFLFFSNIANKSRTKIPSITHELRKSVFFFFCCVTLSYCLNWVISLHNKSSFSKSFFSNQFSNVILKNLRRLFVLFNWKGYKFFNIFQHQTELTVNTL